jgi:hypothetical protein
VTIAVTLAHSVIELRQKYFLVMIFVPDNERHTLHRELSQSMGQSKIVLSMVSQQRAMYGKILLLDKIFEDII